MSKNIHFHKYQGAGNDFILIDNRSLDFDAENRELVEKMCDRRFGIGADGLMLLEHGENADFKMVYFNADGRQSSMCGNGGRCIVAFAQHLGIINNETDFLAVDGQHYARINSDQIALSMIDVLEFKRDGDAYVLQTGSPHYVEKVTGLADLDVYARGYAIRHHAHYDAEGINVNFVEAEANGYFVRTFERGVEDETLACGTGATAAAISIAIDENREGEIELPIRVLGGQLYVSFLREGDRFSNVTLKGPAQLVFSGVYVV